MRTNKLSAQKSNSNTARFNFQRFIYKLQWQQHNWNSKKNCGWRPVSATNMQLLWILPGKWHTISDASKAILVMLVILFWHLESKNITGE